jgi:hypothetical protein
MWRIISCGVLTSRAALKEANDGWAPRLLRAVGKCGEEVPQQGALVVHLHQPIIRSLTTRALRRGPFLAVACSAELGSQYPVLLPKK